VTAAATVFSALMYCILVSFTHALFARSQSQPLLEYD
jgi:hypothetical protein